MVKKLFLVGIMLLSLTGCVKGNVDIEFIDESNASLTIEVLIQEDLLDSYGTSLTDLKHKLTNSELSTWENKELKKDINGTQYIGFQLIAPKDINKSLLSFFTTNKKEGTYQVTIDHSTINNIFNTSEIEDINNYSLTNLKTMGLELNLNIKMPGNISETSYGKIQDNQVKINLLDFLTQDETKSISIISSNRHQTTQPANIFIFVALIIILYIILTEMYKKSNLSLHFIEILLQIL